MGPPDGADQDIQEHADRRTPGARELIAGALDDCREALTAELEAHYGRLDGKLDGNTIEPWRNPVIAFAVFAARHDVPPERALAAFKRMVIQLAPVQRLSVDERNDLVRASVQVAIEAYYR